MVLERDSESGTVHRYADIRDAGCSGHGRNRPAHHCHDVNNKPIRDLETSSYIRATLLHLKHDNIVELINTFDTGQDGLLNAKISAPSHMHLNLRTLIDEFDLLDDHHSYITHQVLSGVEALHSVGIVHRNLRPDNVHINLKPWSVKIGGFVETDPSVRPHNMSHDAQAWYRAPESIVQRDYRGEPMDIWSTGCILGEMLIGDVYFRGITHSQQLMSICWRLGTPTKNDVNAIDPKHERRYLRRALTRPHDTAQCWTNRLGERSVSTLMTAKGGNASESDSDALSLDLLRRLLVWNPRMRLNATQALSHDYLNGLEKDEEMCHGLLDEGIESVGQDLDHRQ